jgi:hypothetical protein
MAKKAKKKRAKQKTPRSYMMVIRVDVPTHLIRRGLKVSRVFGYLPGDGLRCDLEVLNAYYDMRGQPNALT